MTTRPDRPSTRSILADAWSVMGRVGPLVIVPCVLLGLASTGQGQRSDLEPSGAGEVALVIVAMLVVGALEFGVYVWALRRAAPALDVAVRPVDVGSVLWTGVLATAIVIGSTMLLVLPGLVALLLLAMAAPIVAFEGVTGWEALRSSAVAVRSAPGAVAVVLLVLLLAPLPLDIGLWQVALPAWMVAGWQAGLYTVVNVFATAAIGITCIRLRSAAAAPAPRVELGAPVGRVVHDWVAPTGTDPGSSTPVRVPAH